MKKRFATLAPVFVIMMIVATIIAFKYMGWQTYLFLTIFSIIPVIAYYLRDDKCRKMWPMYLLVTVSFLMLTIVHFFH